MRAGFRIFSPSQSMNEMSLLFKNSLGGSNNWKARPGIHPRPDSQPVAGGPNWAPIRRPTRQEETLSHLYPQCTAADL